MTTSAPPHETARGRLLEGKRAIVTGAASGLGRAIAALFHAQGAKVVIADLNAAAAEAAARQIDPEATRAVQVDVADGASVQALFGTAVSWLGGLDVLVNCAGIPQVQTPIEEVPESTWDRILNVNAKSVFLTCKYAVPHFRRAGGGVIVNVASIVGMRPRVGQSAYCASKAATIALTQSLAMELAPLQIRVNVVNPGAADTPMLAGFIDPAKVSVEAAKKAIIGSIPMGSLIQPEDIAEATLYLASPLSRQVTGAILNVDGGRSV